MDEGATWKHQDLFPSSINPRSLVWNSVNDEMALGHDPINDKVHLYLYKAPQHFLIIIIALCYSKLGEKLDQDS